MFADTTGNYNSQKNRKRRGEAVAATAVPATKKQKTTSAVAKAVKATTSSTKATTVSASNVTKQSKAAAAKGKKSEREEVSDDDDDDDDAHDDDDDDDDDHEVEEAETKAGGEKRRRVPKKERSGHRWDPVRVAHRKRQLQQNRGIVAADSAVKGPRDVTAAEAAATAAGLAARAKTTRKKTLNKHERRALMRAVEAEAEEAWRNSTGFHDDDAAKLDVWGVGAAATAAKKAAETDKDGFNVRRGQHRRTDMQRSRNLMRSVVSSGGVKIVPAPGLSVNPAPEAHKASIEKALAADTALAVKSAELRRKLQGDGGEKTLEEWKKVLGAAGPDYDWTQADEPRDPKSKQPVRAEDRLTKTQRNQQKKERRRHWEERKRLEDKAMARTVHELPAILKSFEAEVAEKLEEEERIAKLKAGPDADVRRPRLGPHKFVEQFPAFVMSEDVDAMGGRLANVKPTVTTSLMDDTFKNLQAKALIEPRVKHNLRRRYKLKNVNKSWNKGAVSNPGQGRGS